MQPTDRFAMLESRMLSSNGPALEFSIGFRPPSNPPSNSAMDASLRSPSPSLAAAVHTGDGLASPSGGGAPKRKQSPQDVEGPSPEKRGKGGPSPAKSADAAPGIL